jgi:hypothetical protein
MTTLSYQGDGGYDSEYDILFWIDDYDEMYNTSKEEESREEKEDDMEVMSHWYEEDQIYKKDFRT